MVCGVLSNRSGLQRKILKEGDCKHAFPLGHSALSSLSLLPFFLDRRRGNNGTMRETRLDHPGLESVDVTLTTVIYDCNFQDQGKGQEKRVLCLQLYPSLSELISYVLLSPFYPPCTQVNHTFVVYLFCSLHSINRLSQGYQSKLPFMDHLAKCDCIP